MLDVWKVELAETFSVVKLALVLVKLVPLLLVNDNRVPTLKLVEVPLVMVVPAKLVRPET